MGRGQGGGGELKLILYDRALNRDEAQNYKLASPCENLSSGICGQRRPWSDCADAQSEQGLYCPLTESLDTAECMNGEQMPG